MAAIVSGLRPDLACAGGVGTGFQPLPSSTALSTCGVTTRPPLASDAM